MLTRYAKDDSLKTRMEPFLREFLYVLTYGKNKYKDITRNIEGIYKKRPYEIYKLLTAVIVENVITVREDEKNILQHCLNILIQIASRNKRRNVQTFNREFRGHSHKDSDWVHNMLLRHLESTFDEQDIAFKGRYHVL